MITVDRLLQAGSPLPDVTLFEGSPDNKVALREVFGYKKGVLFAVPGAFTPGCTKVCCTPEQPRSREAFMIFSASDICCLADTPAKLHQRLR